MAHEEPPWDDLPPWPDDDSAIPSRRRHPSPTRDPHRPVPHDLGAERALLGAELLAATAREAAAELSPAAFHRPAHGALHAVLQQLHVDGHDVDTITVAHSLPDADLDALGGASELLALIAGTPATSNARSYVRIVAGHHARRQRIARIDQALNALYLEDDAAADAALQQATDITPAAVVTSSWQPVNLQEVLDEGGPPPPSILTRDDGHHLLYAGKVHAVNAESESGKSWLALLACVEQIARGDHVLYLDFEDAPASILERLHLIGLSDCDIVDRFHYARPDDPLDLIAVAQLTNTLDHHHPSLVIVDGVTEAMVANNWSLLDNDDIARFYSALPRRVARTGAAVLLIDHVPKRRDERGKGGIGGQHKRAGIDGASYLLEVIRPFGRGLDGAARITVDKDRPGHIRAISRGGNDVGELHLTSTSHSIDLRITPPPTTTQRDQWDGPTQCMDAVHAYFQQHPDEQLSRGQTLTRLRAIGLSYRDTTVDTALERLVLDGRLAARNGPRNARLYTTTTPDTALNETF